MLKCFYNVFLLCNVHFIQEISTGRTLFHALYTKDFEAGLPLITLERAAVNTTLGYFLRSTNLWKSPLGIHERNDSKYALRMCFMR